MKSTGSKLSLEKFRIAKLNNISRVIGGSEPGENDEITVTHTDKEGSSLPCKIKTE